MIEVFPETEPFPFLRFVTYSARAATDQLDGLAAIGHMYDYEGSSLQPRHNDFSWLNRAYKALWLSGDILFYRENSAWITQAKDQFEGPVYNADLNPEVINNIAFSYDNRIGWVGGQFFDLGGNADATVFQIAAHFAKENNLDIGVINFFQNVLSISTNWDINLTTTEREAEVSAQFIQAIYTHLGSPEYWNTARPEQITKVTTYTRGLFALDMEYEDPAETHTLIVADGSNLLAEQLKILIRFKGLEKSITLYEGREPEALDLSKFDTIFFTTGEKYSAQHSLFMQKVERTFTGKTLNFRCQHSLLRDSIFTKWKGIGPDFVSAFGYDVPDKEDIPFGPPYIVRAVAGHSGFSNMVLTHDYDYIKQWPWWIWGLDFADWMIEEYIDVSIDGTYDLGRVIFVGDKLFPWYAIRSSEFEARPKRATTQLRSVGPDCFSEIMRGWISDFDSYNQLRNIIDATQIDVGALDFSVKNGKIIPWDVTPKWGHGLIMHWMEESSNNIADVFNEILWLIDNPLRISSDEARTILEESEIEVRPWYKNMSRV